MNNFNYVRTDEMKTNGSKTKIDPFSKNSSFQNVVRLIKSFISDFSKICLYDENHYIATSEKFEKYSSLVNFENQTYLRKYIEKLSAYLLSIQIVFYHT